MIFVSIAVLVEMKVDYSVLFVSVEIDEAPPQSISIYSDTIYAIIIVYIYNMEIMVYIKYCPYDVTVKIKNFNAAGLMTN